ncbi:MAG: hypothetical protein I4E98_21660 [Planktothrix agardhii KL2]|jgi:hypothetical protein|uniref:hypothetical protein n=1 Tax=Planktothrix agardhii TaxID=1160 RepID=UPI001A269276|nr:hypothetical protein [Planktothrix agardhii]MBG0749158.1 hypothetical protein [Planktothrix agardhii KL2]MCF3609749.1 hypothetical protein [Planktothrix agardhii 1033]CAD5985364.1 hypothetical protein NO365_04498 [Planktothrix agardhii]
MKDKLSKILPAFVALGIIGFTAFSIWQSRQTKDKIIMTQSEKLQITEVWQVVSVDSPTGFTIKKGWFDSREIRVCGVEVPSKNSQAAINYLNKLIKESQGEIGVVFLFKDGKQWVTEVYANLGKLPEDFIGERLITQGFAKVTKEIDSCPNGESLRLAQELQLK